MYGNNPILFMSKLKITVYMCMHNLLVFVIFIIDYKEHLLIFKITLSREILTKIFIKSKKISLPF